MNFDSAGHQAFKSHDFGDVMLASMLQCLHSTGRLPQSSGAGSSALPALLPLSLPLASQQLQAEYLQPAVPAHSRDAVHLGRMFEGQPAAVPTKPDSGEEREARQIAYIKGMHGWAGRTAAALRQLQARCATAESAAASALDEGAALRQQVASLLQASSTLLEQVATLRAQVATLQRQQQQCRAAPAGRPPLAKRQRKAAAGGGSGSPVPASSSSAERLPQAASPGLEDAGSGGPRAG